MCSFLSLPKDEVPFIPRELVPRVCFKWWLGYGYHGPDARINVALKQIHMLYLYCVIRKKPLKQGKTQHIYKRKYLYITKCEFFKPWRLQSHNLCQHQKSSLFVVATAGRFSCMKFLTCSDSTTPRRLLSYCRICSTGFMHGAHYLRSCGWCKGKSSSRYVSKSYHKLFWLSILNRFLRLETLADRSTVPNKGKWMNIIRLFVPPNGLEKAAKKTWTQKCVAGKNRRCIWDSFAASTLHVKLIPIEFWGIKTWSLSVINSGKDYQSIAKFLETVGEDW